MNSMRLGGIVCAVVVMGCGDPVVETREEVAALAGVSTAPPQCPASDPVVIGGFDGGEPFLYQPPPLTECSELAGLVDAMVSGAREQLHGGLTCWSVLTGCLVSDEALIAQAQTQVPANVKISPGTCPGQYVDPCLGPVFAVDFAPK